MVMGVWACPVMNNASGRDTAPLAPTSRVRATTSARERCQPCGPLGQGRLSLGFDDLSIVKRETPKKKRFYFVLRQRLRSAFISTDWAGAAATPASPAACDPVRRSLGAEESRIIPPLRLARRSFALTHDRTPRAGRGGGGAARARRHETGRVSRPAPPPAGPAPPSSGLGCTLCPCFLRDRDAGLSFSLSRGVLHVQSSWGYVGSSPLPRHTPGACQQTLFVGHLRDTRELGRNPC